MQYISWQDWYSKWKDKKPLNEITSDYNCYIYQYETYEQYEHCLRKLGSETRYILQQDRNDILQQNGFRLVWQIKL